jgi:hypothetical protein
LPAGIVRRLSPALSKDPSTRPTAEQLLHSFIGDDTVVGGVDRTSDEVRKKLDETWITDRNDSDHLADEPGQPARQRRSSVLLAILVVALASAAIWKLPSVLGGSGPPPRPHHSPTASAAAQRTVPAASHRSNTLHVGNIGGFGETAQRRLSELVASAKATGLCGNVTQRSASAAGPYVVCDPHGPLKKVVVGTYYSRQTLQTGLGSTPGKRDWIVIYKPEGLVFTYQGGGPSKRAALKLAHQLGSGAVFLHP